MGVRYLIKLLLSRIKVSDKKKVLNLLLTQHTNLKGSTRLCLSVRGAGPTTIHFRHT
jgi:hypothetical protein